MDLPRNLIYRERTELAEALELPICQLLYDKLKLSYSEESARKECISLCNDVWWLVCQDLFTEWGIPREMFYTSASGTHYDYTWVLAQVAAFPNVWTHDWNIEVFSDKHDNYNDLYIKIRDERKWWNEPYYNIHSYVIDFAPIKQWGDLSQFSPEFWNTITFGFEDDWLDILWYLAKTYNERLLLKNTINDAAKKIFESDFTYKPVYKWLLKAHSDLQKEHQQLLKEEQKRKECAILRLVRDDGKKLDVLYLRRQLELLIEMRKIPVKGNGYVWLAVWLFMKKMNILKGLKHSYFYELMKAWFPNKDYGKPDKMRIYNCDYLKNYNCHIWKYEEFKKIANPKTSEKGFNAITTLSIDLENYIKPSELWIAEED